MIIFPAIDLRRGHVVRLRQGCAEDETIYSDDPAEMAKRWQGEGADWLHVVNLDAAFGDIRRDVACNVSANIHALQKILAAVSIPAQFGGGLRDMASIEAAFARGVARVVIGTAAIENPQLVSEALARFGAERIVVGVDAHNGMVATRGWRKQSLISDLDLARQMRARGVTRIVYTDIARDGMLRGVDADAMAELARAANVRVIASGGVGSLLDIQALAARQGIEGVIIGQALYTRALNLKEAIQVASNSADC